VILSILIDRFNVLSMLNRSYRRGTSHGISWPVLRLAI